MLSAALIRLGNATCVIKSAFRYPFPRWFRRLETRENMELHRIVVLRPNLDRDVVLDEAYKLSSTTIESPEYYLRAFELLAMKGEPMPWEKEFD